MIIKKFGKKSVENAQKFYEGKCGCGCEFDCKSDDLQILEGSKSSFYFCFCPDCGGMIGEKELKEISKEQYDKEAQMYDF